MHTNKSETSTPRITPEPIRERFPKEWNQLKTSARSSFSKLTEDDVRAVNGRYEEFSDRLRKAYNYSQDRIDTEILKFMSSVTPGQTMTSAGPAGGNAPPTASGNAPPYVGGTPTGKH
jgi:uncharacterized protein YjbJ (UPF0337 family)